MDSPFCQQAGQNCIGVCVGLARSDIAEALRIINTYLIARECF